MFTRLIYEVLVMLISGVLFCFQDHFLYHLPLISVFVFYFTEFRNFVLSLMYSPCPKKFKFYMVKCLAIFLDSTIDRFKIFVQVFVNFLMQDRNMCH